MPHGTGLAKYRAVGSLRTKPSAGGSRTRILRREDSLKSRQYRGICLRVLYECDGLEIVRSEMEPGGVLEGAELADCNGLHFVIAGSPVFRVADQTTDLMPGDSIAIEKGQGCTVSNPASSPSSILSFLFKTRSSCLSAGAGPTVVKASGNYKEIS